MLKIRILNTFRSLSLVPLLIAVSAQQALAAAQISGLKTLPDMSPASLSGVTVTAAFPGYFYVQDADGAGIRISVSRIVSRGQKMNISGLMRTESNAERSVQATRVELVGAGEVSAISMRCRDVGGGDYDFDAGSGTGQRGITGGIGVNSIGRYIQCYGRVVGGAVINDGSGDIRLLLPAEMPSPAFDSYVAVAGISTLVFAGGSYLAAVNVPSSSELVTAEPAAGSSAYSDPMIYIPAGSFMMGALPSDAEAFPLEKPQHQVYLDGYWIGKYEVTRGEYQKFIDAGGYTNSQYWSSDGWYYKNLYQWTKPAWWSSTLGIGGETFVQTARHPVVGVSWYEAEAYCNWAGLRLLTEAEWEKAAHWNPATSTATIYPWGSDWTSEKCNWWGDSLYTDRKTAPAGSYPSGASYYGCMDMAGNLWEWVNDSMEPDYFKQTPPGGWVNPTGPPPNEFGTKILKGGSYYAEYPGPLFHSGCRSSSRAENYARWDEYPNKEGTRQGFRVAR